MDYKNFLFLSFILLLPKQVENILQIYQANGNIGLHGVFLGVYYCRNAFWTTIGLFLFTMFTNVTLAFKIFISICSVLFLIKYVTYIKKYENTFENIFIQI